VSAIDEPRGVGRIGRIPPHDLAAERSVLGSILIEPPLIDDVSDILRPDDWYSEANAVVWRAMLELHAERTPIDSVTLRQRLVATGQLARAGGDEYLLELTNTIPTVANIEHHARLIRDLATARAMILAAHEIAAEGYRGTEDVPGFIDRAARAVLKVVDSAVRTSTSASVRTMLETEWRSLETAAAGGGRVKISTGLTRLDKLTRGLERGHVWYLAARPGMGKTALARQIAVHVAQTSGPVKFFSLEMTRSSLAQRHFAAEARIKHDRIRAASIDAAEWSKLGEVLESSATLPLDVDDEAALTPTQIRSRARRFKRARGDLVLVIVDYLQIMRADERLENRNVEVAAMSGALKAMAKDLDCAVLALSQLNRSSEKRGDRRPILSDLRDSGAVEQDADVVLFVHRPEYYNRRDFSLRNKAEIIVEKARHAATGTAEVAFFGEYTRFDNLADEYDPADYQDEPAQTRLDQWGRRQAAEDAGA
jgi:replicative DNA helicase